MTVRASSASKDDHEHIRNVGFLTQEWNAGSLASGRQRNAAAIRGFPIPRNHGVIYEAFLSWQPSKGAPQTSLRVRSCRNLSSADYLLAGAGKPCNP
ncbi:hypothetical protein XFF6990_160025 [Xanthomonas citri pv. fuscans]|nr:hypothetical protein XFF6990_160025 [Xanthomonas citri pv. fuscans]